MIQTDYHIHTSFSFDSEAEPTDVIEAAIRKGLTAICITDHYDIEYPHGDDFTMDLEVYTTTIRALSKKYQDQIDVFCGIEIGMDLRYATEIHELLSAYTFDFIIGSVHVIEGCDFYYGDYFKGKTKEEAHAIYFETVYMCLQEFREIDVVGHLDYITRYGAFDYHDWNTLDISLHQTQIEKIIDFLVEHKKGIEINTSGYRYGCERAYPSAAIVQQYLERNGKYVTFGSDAHTARDVGVDEAGLAAYPLGDVQVYHPSSLE